MNTAAKYSEGDVFIHREIPNERRVILCVDRNKNEVKYMINNVDKSEYPPSPIEESMLDKYYIQSREVGSNK
jgi:hypothetical protein